MNRPAPRSIDEYLNQLRTSLAGEDPALIQDALYDAEEYLRAEVAANAGKSEADVLELIASTYGAPDEVATAYRDTETKVKAALTTPRRVPVEAGPLRRFFGVFLDVRAYTSLFLMLLALATGIIYFTIAVTGLSLSLGLSILIIGIPFFLAFIGITRVIALGEGRLIEALTGERMPRRPEHPGPARTIWQRIGEMLRDWRTWSTLLYMLLALPLGILYFTLAVCGITIGSALTLGSLYEAARLLGLHNLPGGLQIRIDEDPQILQWLATPGGLLLMFVAGVLLVTLTLHAARAIGKGHARLAKAMLVVR
jgi:uncharacterized membrane protein